MSHRFRTEECKERYVAHIQNGGLDTCPLCNRTEEIRAFTHWRIIPNNFPYDRIASVHHMLVPRRHATEHELTAEEWDEFRIIKQEHLMREYEYLIEASTAKRSIPDHFHLHLIIAKEL